MDHKRKAKFDFGLSKFFPFWSYAPVYFSGSSAGYLDNNIVSFNTCFMSLAYDPQME
jgi:hypothetical protein